jgi:hypothetical protein
MDIKLTSEKVALTNKSRNIDPLNEHMVAFLRRARPMKAFLVVRKRGNEFKIKECEVPNLESLDAVIDQGFDPNGPCGPTYWRMTESHYYSTMLTEQGVVLAITELTRSPR